MPAFKTNDPVYDQLTDMLAFIVQRHLRSVSMGLTIDDAYNILIAPERREQWRVFSFDVVPNARGGDINIGRGLSLYVRGSDDITAPVIPRVAYVSRADGVSSCDEAANFSFRRIREVADSYLEMREKLSYIVGNFNTLNCACDNPKQMRAIWPGLIQLLEFTRNTEAVKIAGEIIKASPLRKEIDHGMTRDEYREWAGLIGSGMLMGGRNEPLLPVAYIR